ncbi:thioesterase II family protein [Streptomyces albus]|uniref:thioesterase II family protein n=1 Tax=Streptomyces albus TaxID=1888 RepID=UPI0033F2EAB6
MNPPDADSPDPGHLRWLPSLRAGPQPAPEETALFCVPYAGGSTALYQPWWAACPKDVRVVPVQLPGRMERLREKPLRSARSIAEQLGEAVAATGARRFALFGISMGALVAFETAHWLTAAGLPPAHLFVASSPGPSLLRSTPGTIHTGPDEELVAVLRRLGTTPPELLADTEIRQLLLPVLRADFAVTETYVYPRREPLVSPLTVLWGDEDRYLDEAVVDAWRQETCGQVRVRRFASGHFLLPERSAELLGLVRAALASPAPAGQRE